LLSSSFRPESQVCAVRSILRLRSRLVACAADQTRLIHKILTQMNIQLQHVISDVTGLSGLTILNAILAGERDPLALAKLCDPRIKASTDTIARSLNGPWRAELLFCLRSCLDTFYHFQTQITGCDKAIEKLLLSWDSQVDLEKHPLPKRPRRSGQHNAFHFDARLQSYRLFGIDLTAVPCIGEPTTVVLLAELGPDFAKRFATAKHFSSWLGLCPDNRITGGRILSSKTRDVKSRVAQALRMAACNLTHAKNHFGDLFRRLKSRLSTPEAITAMAHKLARILWHMVRFHQEFDPSKFQRAEERFLQKRILRLHKSATALGFHLSKIQ
jgi:transposase